MSTLRDLVPAGLRGDLTKAEEAVLTAAATGEIADLRTGDAEKDNPKNAEQWDRARTIRVPFLRWLCTSPETARQIDLRGVRATGVKIEGSLDLAFAILPHPLELTSCAFGAADLSCASIPRLDFTGSVLSQIFAPNVDVKGSLQLDRTAVAHGVSLKGARIGCDLSCSGSVFENPDGVALYADSLTVEGNVNLNDGFSAEGEVVLMDAEIGGNLGCMGATLENPDGDSLSADRVTIGGSVYLSGGFSAKGEVRLHGAKIGGNLSCGKGATFENPEGHALSADGATIGGGAFFTKEFSAKGMVRLPDVKIGSILGCTGATFENAGGSALFADRVTIGGSVFLSDGFSAKGGVRLLGANIGGQLACGGGEFSNPGGRAFTAHGARIDGRVFLDHDFIAEGSVSFRGAILARALRCDDASFKGGLDLSDSRIEQGLFCTNCTFDHPDGDALSLERGEVRGVLKLSGISSIKGKVDLRFAHVSQFHDVDVKWPEGGNVLLEGFVYDSLGDVPKPIKDHLEWLDLQPEQPLYTQPYEQLATVFRGMGREKDAREVHIAKRRVLRERGQLSAVSKGWSWFLDKSIGYGYERWRLIIPLLFFFLLGAGIFSLSDGTGAMCYTEPVAAGFIGPPTPIARGTDFQPFVYSLDAFVQIVNLHQDEKWTPTSTSRWGFVARWYLWLHILCGWLWTTLTAASLTRILRTD